MHVRGRTVEEELARLAHRQHGQVTGIQLLECGVTRSEIEVRLRKGLLIREYRGVYRVGHRAPSLEAEYLGAVLACGEGAVLSGRAAAYLYGLLEGAAPPPEVTAPREKRVEGVSTRRVRHLDPRDWAWYRSIPVTTVPRTLVDIAGHLGTEHLALACHKAGTRYGTTPERIEASLSRCPNARGAAQLRTILRGNVRVTLSKLERAFLARLREAGLPLPQTNRPAGGRLVDCRWPDPRVTVELDSYRYHGSRHAWEQDRRREREAYARGDEFRRYTYADVVESPALMLAELRTLLGPGHPG